MISKWIRKTFDKITESIAFYPALIAIGFLLLSWLTIHIDFSEWGKNLKAGLSWLSLKDASTARVIISTIIGGIMSLTVFSFSMVMIVINQAASQMSNRILNSMIENRYQQIVLGFYIGTIVYALFLLSTIRDIQSGIYIPAISIYLLILLTVVDIFFFIYFLNYITETVKYETVIHRVQMKTLDSMKKNFCAETDKYAPDNTLAATEVIIQTSGYYQGYNTRQMMQLANEKDVVISFLHERGTYLIKGCVLAMVYSKKEVKESTVEKILMAADFYKGQPIEKNANYGFHQLAEIAIKALSPGINDPATAVLSINALTDLFAYRLHHCLPSLIKNKEGNMRIMIKTATFKDLFSFCIFPIWSYGKEDMYIQDALLYMLAQLKKADYKNEQMNLFNQLYNNINTQLKKREL